MYYQITKTLPLLLLLAVLTFTYSCNDTVDPTPTTTSESELTEEQVFELLMEELAHVKKESNITEVDYLEGDSSESAYRGLEPNKQSNVDCDTPPNCLSSNISGSTQFTTNGATCEIQYSYQLFNCGNGDLTIFNFQIVPLPSQADCPAFYFGVTQNLAAGQLIRAQQITNLITAIVLNTIETSLTLSQPNSITTYIPNYCVLTCEDQQECGEDCCIRTSRFVYNGPEIQKSTTVTSAQGCGGDIVACPVGSNIKERLCENYNCQFLDR